MLLAKVSLRTRSKRPPRSTPTLSKHTAEFVAVRGEAPLRTLPFFLPIPCPVLHPRQQQERRPREEECRGKVGGVAHPLGRHSRKRPGKGASQAEQRAPERVLCGGVSRRSTQKGLIMGPMAISPSLKVKTKAATARKPGRAKNCSSGARMASAAERGGRGCAVEVMASASGAREEIMERRPISTAAPMNTTPQPASPAAATTSPPAAIRARR